jgi:DNA-binding NtrC family response regulator
MSINSRSKSILLVDNEPDIVYLFKYVLESRNYDVYGFTNPLEALEHYKPNCARYGLVISDIRMPVMTGFDLLKNLRKIDVNISLILMSAYDIIDFSELDGIKIDGFMQKPITIRELLSTIEKHFININVTRL